MIDGNSGAVQAAQEFGGADGYGHIDHDSASNLTIGDQAAFDSMMEAAGNTNQYHTSDLGKQQLERVFSIAEELGYMKDGTLDANEMGNVEGLLRGETTVADLKNTGEADPNANEATITGLVDEVLASKAELESGMAGTPEDGAAGGAEAAGAEAAAAEAEALDAFIDEILAMWGGSAEAALEAWPDNKEDMLGDLRAKLEEMGLSEEEIESKLAEFEQSMDAAVESGDAEAVTAALGAVSEGAVDPAEAGGEMDAEAAETGDLAMEESAVAP